MPVPSRTPTQGSDIQWRAPRYARNPGGAQPTASAVGLYPADQQIFHNPRHPSSITLSVLRPQ
jgi:hypothetical protein